MSPRAAGGTRTRAEAAPAPVPPTRVVARVDLLSPWVHERLRVQRLRRRFGIGLVALLVLLAGSWTWQRLSLTGAEADLRGEEATATSLTRQMAALAPVRAYADGVRIRAARVRELMVTEVALSDVLDHLRAAAPDGLRLESLAVDLAGDVDPRGGEPAAAPASVVAADGTIADPARGLVATCPGPDPFAQRLVVGCLTLTGTAGDRAQVAALIRALGEDDLFVEPFVSATTSDGPDAGGVVEFTGSVGLSPRTFTGRYDDLPQRLGVVGAGPAAATPTGQEAGR